MHVDRTKFLVLTAAIASACGTSPKPEPTVVKASAGPDYDTTSSGAGSAEPEPENHFVKEAAPPEPPPVQPGPVAPCSEGPCSPIDEGYMYPTTPRPQAPIDPKLAKQCASLRRPGPVCESFDSVIESCNHYPEVMVTKAAQAAVKCLSKKSGTSKICDFGVEAVCALEGAKAAPAASTAAQACGDILKNCSASGYRGKDLTKANCQAAIAGFKSDYRNALISCIQEFCEVSSCFYQMR